VPTYEYECKICGLRFERRQAITDAPLAECPECRGEVRRLVSGGAGFILKDNGRRAGACSMKSQAEPAADVRNVAGSRRAGVENGKGHLQAYIRSRVLVAPRSLAGIEWVDPAEV
jgi:putative FmdB family regulatory protein